jgi:hypothetical protein
MKTIGLGLAFGASLALLATAASAGGSGGGGHGGGGHGGRGGGHVHNHTHNNIHNHTNIHNNFHNRGGWGRMGNSGGMRWGGNNSLKANLTNTVKSTNQNWNTNNNWNTATSKSISSSTAYGGNSNLSLKNVGNGTGYGGKGGNASVRGGNIKFNPTINVESSGSGSGSAVSSIASSIAPALMMMPMMWMLQPRQPVVEQPACPGYIDQYGRCVPVLRSYGSAAQPSYAQAPRLPVGECRHGVNPDNTCITVTTKATEKDRWLRRTQPQPKQVVQTQ